MATEQTTRRAMLGAIGTAAALAVAAPTAALTAEQPTEAAASDDQAWTIHPLEDFAFAWLKRWTEKGGDAYMGKQGKAADWDTITPKLMISHPTYHFTPVYEDNLAFYDQWRIKGLAACAEADRESIIANRMTFDQYFHEGKVRELFDLLSAVPGGWGAVEAIIDLEPSLGVGRRLPCSRAIGVVPTGEA